MVAQLPDGRAAPAFNGCGNQRLEAQVLFACCLSTQSLCSSKGWRQAAQLSWLSSSIVTGLCCIQLSAANTSSMFEQGHWLLVALSCKHQCADAVHADCCCQATGISHEELGGSHQVLCAQACAHPAVYNALATPHPITRLFRLETDS